MYAILEGGENNGRGEGDERGGGQGRVRSENHISLAARVVILHRKRRLSHHLITGIGASLGDTLFGCCDLVAGGKGLPDSVPGVSRTLHDARAHRVAAVVQHHHHVEGGLLVGRVRAAGFDARLPRIGVGVEVFARGLFRADVDAAVALAAVDEALGGRTFSSGSAEEEGEEDDGRELPEGVNKKEGKGGEIEKEKKT